MRRFLDLSLPVKKHWRWPFQKTFLRDYFFDDPLREEILYLAVHCFTHIDPPGHADPEGKMIDEIALEDLIGVAKILDLSHKGENEEITGEDLEQAGRHVKPGDIVLVKTCHDRRYTISSRWNGPEASAPFTAIR